MVLWSDSSSVRDLGKASVLWDDGELVFCRTRRAHGGGEPQDFFALLPSGDPTPTAVARLQHEYDLRDQLGEGWAVRPLALTNERGRPVLFLEPSPCDPLDGILGAPLEIGHALRIGTAVSAAIGGMHRRGLVHRDIKPRHLLVDAAGQSARLTGFGSASRLLRERQAARPPQFIAGTLAYMAPEQTGRMNRSVDHRSDLYSLGVVLYEMVTGALPFAASDPMEWVHCHIARKPTPPNERVAETPAVVSAIIMKLLAKSAEARYQTAAALERDLRQCRAQWESHHRVDEFFLASNDVPERIQVPEKLYGRAHEIDALLTAFTRVADEGAPELVLVAGSSGVGKSSVVNELHRVLAARRGLFAAGKFDQYARNIPYATLAQAFQSLVRPLLGRSKAELARWREALLASLGPLGQLMVDLVPELKFIIGEQEPVPRLPPKDEQRRFRVAFFRFVSVFARPEHPLVLFLDDLQWLDESTLDVLYDLSTHPDLRHMLLIGAYRPNEIEPGHPFLAVLQAIRSAGTRVDDILLEGLERGDVAQLIADTVHRERSAVDALASLMLEKTGGNPFFVVQLLTSLAEQGLIAFDPAAARWTWELERIHASVHPHNIVDLMVDKLERLPSAAATALRHLACLGNGATASLLALIHGTSAATLRADLEGALQDGLILHFEDAYRFSHDRVQEAGYSLVPEGDRAETHVRIGRALLAQTAPAELEQMIFLIVGQLNRGDSLVTSPLERAEIARLNLVAGRRAKASAAHAAALAYFAAGEDLLGLTGWADHHSLAFSLGFHRAECELVTGELESSETRLSWLTQRALGDVERGEVACLRASLFTNLDRPERAVEIGLEFLRTVDINLPMYATDAEVRDECECILRRLGEQTVEELFELPAMSDPTSRAALDVLISIETPAHFVDRNLVPLLICRATSLSLEHGNTAGSSFAYVYFGIILESRFGDYTHGLRFGELGVALAEREGFERFRVRTLNNFAMAISPWASHVRTSVDILWRASVAAREAGDLTFMGFSVTRPRKA